LGFSASYFPGKKAIYSALDQGINFFFGYGFDYQLTSIMRDILKRDRARYVIATGAYNFIWGYPNLRRSLEKRLRQFGTDYFDVFMFLGVMKEEEFPEAARDELSRLKEEGKIRNFGMSCHNRKFAGTLGGNGSLDTLMIRYNAAHRGAEVDIFPHLQIHNPGVISYTATRWTYLLRRPKNWPKRERIPTAGECYRFVLSNPHVHVCLTAPRNGRQLRENIKSLESGPLSSDDLAFMKSFGDNVHHTKKWFM
jgi:aryl-alcohol dehydrogenase-like predicted oxidoreductase